MDAREIAKEVRVELKKEFPGYTFSITSDYSSMTVALMSAPASPWINPVDGEKAYEQLNHFYLDRLYEEHLTPTALKMLKEVTKISNRKNYDHSDSQSDYFDVGYYFNLQIGKWDKPFQVKA